MRMSEDRAGKREIESEKERYGPQSTGDNRPREEAAHARTLIVCVRIIAVRANGILLHAEERRRRKEIYMYIRACASLERPYIALNSETRKLHLIQNRVSERDC